VQHHVLVINEWSAETNNL